ncbi:DNA-directed RNA polymerase subunit H [Methanobacterium alkalithermotolerans]|uniref:DNA-directed RNA polymerase subunit Rpo5 n=1 Tax=Methanobacterium alkalithermotolerans TaxID=2731220 RepID=A0A8T8K8B2_9EURY|nr:DNA-directed RNA polymerase subunit H [Methanobacterium alkalithermotolerans]RJS48640.1 MAG: DNA-directed RNA polymerase subunit H [Methanobacterium sp.]
MVKKDILKHEMVPDHAVLSKSEFNKVLKKMDIHLEQLPKIKSDDPVAKAIGAKEGDILEITRKSSTAGKFITYRLVKD